jgi:putative ABC transport system permease protein
LFARRINWESEVRRNVSHILLGRLKLGVTPGQAQSEMDVLAARNRQEIQLYQDVNYHIEVVPLHEDLVEPVRPIVLALFGAVGFVLLIACVNVANLLLVRATTRSQEISVRAALGGSRRRLIQQMLSESLVLSVVGGAIGLALAAAGIRVLTVMRPEDLPRMETIGIDGVVLAFTLVTSIVAAAFFGMLPALQASRTNLATALKTRSDASGASLQQSLRSGMVVVEVALSLVLLIGAGLMVRSFVALTRVDPGFNPAGVLTFQASPPGGVFQGQEGRASFFNQMRERIGALPGVQAVGAGRPLPLTKLSVTARYGTEAALADPELFQQGTYRTVTQGYFEAMQTNVIAGRAFGPADYADSLPFVLVDDVLAQKTWPNESAVGKRLIVRPFPGDPFPVEVVGVVEHQRHEDLSREGRETYYLTHRFANNPTNLTWTVRAAVDPLTLVGPLRRVVEEIHPDIPLTDVRTMQSYVDSARAPTRFALVLIAIFGVSALILASVGLYGVLAYAVRQRTAEIGIRMAFGAQPGAILGLIVKYGMRLAGIGLAVGLAGAFAVTRFMSSLLVDVPAVDLVTYVVMAAFFLAVAGLASYVPALRATRVDPVVALGEE